ncbi:MAG: lipopolysaccharide kinase InaA family protein [Sedimentisphaerales bacterium]
MTFQKIKISAWQFEINDDFPAKFPPGSKDNFTDGRRSSFTKLPSSKSANVFKFNLLFKGKVHNLILKQFSNRSPLDIFKNLLLSCRSYRAFKADLMLRQHGFAPPDVVAVGKKTIAGIPVRNLIITREITDSVPLHKILEINAAQRQEIISQFGLMVGRMHAENIFHGDLRFGNVLVKKENDKFTFFLLDNERTKKFKELPLRLRLKNLVQIYISRTNAEESERKCFLDAYLSQQNVKIDRGKFAAQLAARVKKRLSKKNHE